MKYNYCMYIFVKHYEVHKNVENNWQTAHNI